MRDLAGLERLNEGTCQVSPEVAQVPKEETHMSGLHPDALTGTLPFRDGPPALPDQPIDPCRYRIRERLVNAGISDLAKITIGPRHGQRDHGWLRGLALAIASEWHVRTLACDEPWGKRSVDGFLNLGHRTEAHR